MTESIPAELELECLRVILAAPTKYQQEMRSKVRQILITAQSEDEARREVGKCCQKIARRTEHARNRNAGVDFESDEGGRTESSKAHRAEEQDEQAEDQKNQPEEEALTPGAVGGGGHSSAQFDDDEALLTEAVAPPGDEEQ